MKENVLVMIDAFSKFSMAVIMPNQYVKTVAKTLVDKWFYTYGKPARIHSDQGKIFNEKILKLLCKFMVWNSHLQHHIILMATHHWVFQLYIAESFEDTLPKDQKPNWPAHLGALMFAYNVTPYSMTGYQLYQLMFGHKAQTPYELVGVVPV